MTPVRLLITARDVAGALHLIEVAKAARRDERFALTVVAQEPAARHVQLAGIEARTVAWPIVASAEAPSAPRLREQARQLLAEIAPDIVLSGLSTPFDASLDEAILAEARVPTALYQDFWGEQNLLLGRGAEYIFAIDDQAAERNRTRFDRSSIVVGSARHAAYASFDIDARRRQVRGEMNTGSRAVIGFFGQALHALPGYARTVHRFIDAARALPDTVVLLRPHPRETAAQRAQTEAMFADAGLPVRLASTGPVEDAIAACDAVVSLFSICTFDAAYLNRFSTHPVAVPVSLLFDEEIADYCRQHGNYLDFSHHTLGLVKPVYKTSDVPGALASALLPETCRDVWERAHRYLPDPSLAPQRVLDHLFDIAGRAAGAPR